MELSNDETKGAHSSGLLRVEPNRYLVFQGPFTKIVASQLKLVNTSDSLVAFKVKTTVPKRYSVQPCVGFIRPNEEQVISVMHQPFVHDQSEKAKHKFLVQAITVTEDETERLMEVFKDRDPSVISEHKLSCILRMGNELVIEPNSKLSLETPVSKSTSATVQLSNPSQNILCFKVDTSDHLTANPVKGYLNPSDKTDINVTAEHLGEKSKDLSAQYISIKSAVTADVDDEKCNLLLSGSTAKEVSIMCTFHPEGYVASEKVRSVNSSRLASAPPTHPVGSPNADGVEKLKHELELLRKENQTLKLAEMDWRRAALSSPCMRPDADGGGAVGAIARAPIVLYLLLMLIAGLVLGKYAL